MLNVFAYAAARVSQLSDQVQVVTRPVPGYSKRFWQRTTPYRSRAKALALVPVLLILLAFVGPLPIAPVHADASVRSPLDPSQIDAYVTRLMDTYQVPGVALALVKDGQIVYTHGYGVRDVATGVPVTDHTLFAIGSISKSFTALAITQLASSGKLRLDDLVLKYLPDLKLADDQATATLTIRELLAQVSGLPRADDLWLPQAPASRQQIVTDLAKVKLVAQPGQRFYYSNQNYVLLGYLLERITGQSWEQYVRDHILQPLDMGDSVFDIVAMQHSADFARPHILDERAGVISIGLSNTDIQWLVTHGPAVSISASALDMARYMQFQLGDGTYNGAAVSTSAMLAEMHRTQANTGPTSPLVSGGGYGFGWFTERYRGQSLVEHSGDVKGFAANITLLPSAGTGVALLTNSQVIESVRQAIRLRMIELLAGMPAQQDIAQTLDRLNDLDPVTRLQAFKAARQFRLDGETLRKLSGDYDGTFGKMHVDLAGDRLYARREGWLVLYEMAAFAPGQLLFAAGSLSDSMILTYQIDARDGVTLSENGQPVLFKLPPGKLQKASNP